MREFGVEVSTDELVALERALRGLGTDEARSAVAKAHRDPGLLVPKEREAVLAAARIALDAASGATKDSWKGLARLAVELESELEPEQQTEVDAPPTQRRSRSTGK
jgi:hypothetical protein